MRKVLFVIDMQNDFVSGDGALSFPAARGIIPFVVGKIREALAGGREVLFTLDTHVHGDAEFNKFPAHCIEGTPGHELIPEIKEIIEPYKSTGKVKILKKNRYSAFYNTDLDTWLDPPDKGERVDEVEMVGVCTNICCFFTAEELANRDIPVTVWTRGMASFDPEAHRLALQQMRDILGADVRE